MPLLDSNTSHQIMDTNPDEEFSPNSYLLRACSGPQQAASSGKETLWCLNVCCVVPDLHESPTKGQLLTQRRGEGAVGGIKVKSIRHFRGVAVLRCIC